MKRILFPAFLAILIAMAGLAAGTVQAQGPDHVTTVEGISEYRLDNGLRILLMPDRSRPTVTVNVTYFVGSKHESYGETGMAHLLEHMLFYGTERHQDIKREISERGGFANGTTWYERTNYFQTLPAEEENLEWVLQMESDRMVNSRIDPEDLEGEMTVVRNEFEIGENNPMRVLMQRVAATALEWHGYGRSTIGARADIENVPIERLHQFYQRFYQPDNAMVIISGNFDSERALALVEENFGPIPVPVRDETNQLWPTYTREPTQDGPREVTVRRSGVVPMLMAAYHVPAAPHPDFAPLQTLGFILGDSPSGRLHKRLVEGELASQVGSFVMTLPEPSLMLLFATLPRDAEVDQVRAEFMATIDDLAEQPPSDEEVQRAVRALTSSMEQALNDSNRIGISLSEWAAVGDWRMMFLHRDRLEEVSAERVREVAARYMVRDNRTVGTFIPDSEPRRAEIPEAPALEELLADYAGREDRAEGEDFQATPDNIESRIVRFELSNGAKVALLPKATRGERVRATIAMRIGNLDTLAGSGAVPSVTGAMLARGTENHTRQEIRDRLDELQSSLNVGGAPVVSGTIESRRDSIAGVVELMAEMFQRPTFPESELEEYRRQALTSIDQQRDEPGAVASQALSKHFNVHPPEHPLYVTDFDESEARLRAVTRDELVDLHRRLYGFGPGTSLTFVGDFDAEALRAQLEDLFGDWNQDVAFERLDTPYQDVEPETFTIQLDDKANAILIARQSMQIRDDHPDWPALQMAGHLLGGGFLTSRLGKRIRDDEGLSYAVGGGFSAGPIDEVGSFSAFAAFNPGVRDRVREVMFEELDKALADGFEEDELESGRTGLLQQMRLMRSDDASLANRLNNGLYLDRDMHYDAEQERKIAELTLDEVNQALGRWLDPSRLTIATAGDFETTDDEG